jgi:hypothetical protein
MVCRGCNAENPSAGKFCTSCGAPLGITCNRCGIVNELDDHFCGTCGSALVGSLSEESSASFRSATSLGSSATTKQYSPQEIEELLALRRVLKKEESSAEALSQDDVDKLFG